MTEPIPDTRVLCYCRNVDYGQVRQCINDARARNIEQVMEHCNAGTGCRSCHPEIEVLLVEAAATRSNAPGVLAAIKKLFGK